MLSDRLSFILQQMTAKRNDPMTGVSPNDLMAAKPNQGFGLVTTN